MLTAKQQKFVNEYMIDLNATQAAIRSGYSENAAQAIGAENLAKPLIKQAIEQAQEAQAERLKITSDWVVNRLKLISDRCVQAVGVVEFNKETQAYELTGEWKFDSSGANKATELIGKHLGMFTEKVELTGKDGGAIKVELTFDEKMKLLGMLNGDIPAAADSGGTEDSDGRPVADADDTDR